MTRNTNYLKIYRNIQLKHTQNSHVSFQIALEIILHYFFVQSLVFSVTYIAFPFQCNSVLGGNFFFCPGSPSLFNFPVTNKFSNFCLFITGSRNSYHFNQFSLLTLFPEDLFIHFSFCPGYLLKLSSKPHLSCFLFYFYSLLTVQVSQPCTIRTVYFFLLPTETSSYLLASSPCYGKAAFAFPIYDLSYS